MTHLVDIDVRTEQAGNRTLPRLIVGTMLMTGVIISAVGVQHKREKAKTTVAWHNVSDTLHQVEHAKADLFATLRDKSR